MKIPLYQVDAFAEHPFEGNPAAVCPLDRWLPDAVMQAVAAENNLSETAFFVAEGEGDFHIRWFTPQCEVDLCGHATLATAHILFATRHRNQDTIRFTSKSGDLIVGRDHDRLVLDFPAQPPRPCPLPAAARQAFAAAPQECLQATDYLLVFADEDEILAARPDMQLLRQLDLRGVIISAPAGRHDFVCRFFAPNFGIPEDPVTGSAFTQLAPYWAARLGRDTLQARQLSRRGGEVGCRLAGDRVQISGRAVTYLEGTIVIPETWG